MGGKINPEILSGKSMQEHKNPSAPKRELSVKPWLAASILVTLFLILLLGWNLFFSYDALNSFKNRELAVERASWKLQLYAETMKSATRISTLSGDLRWKQTHDVTESKLQKVLGEIPLLTESGEIRRRKKEIEACLANISRIETKAYDLVKQGDKQEAERLLAGWDYTKNQIDFETATKELGSLIRARIEQKVSFQRTQSLAMVVMAFVCLGALIFLWTVTIRLWSIETRRKRQAEKEKARMEEQFYQSQKLESIGRLAGGVAHDLNNLLSPILGYSEILLSENNLDHKDSRHLKEIVNAGRRAKDLVSQLLAFGRKQSLNFYPVDLNELLKNFEKLLRLTVRDNVEIRMNLAPGLPLVKAEEGQIEQVVMNLAVNAQDAMPDGGILSIETAEQEIDESSTSSGLQGLSPGRYVMLAVSDTGCGMDEHTCENLFEPFFTTKEAGKGTGLGLSTVYGIVKQHGGNIWACGESGQGAVFKVCLPVV